MAAKKIIDMTIKDIFDSLLGKKNARNVLAKIQKEYDNGVRGEALKDFANRTIKEIPDLNSEIVKFAVFATQVSASHSHPNEPLTEPLKI